MGNYKQSGTKFYGYGNSHSKGKGGPKFNIMGMLDKAKGFMGGGATKYTSPAKDYDIDKGPHGHPHENKELETTPTEYSTPAKSGLGATVKKGGVKSEFDIDDAMDLKKQNKAKKAELLKKYRNKEISADEYHSDIREIASYENPE